MNLRALSWDDILITAGQAAIIASGFLAGWLLYRLAVRIIRRMTKTEQSAFPSYLVRYLKHSLKWLIIACTVNVAFYFIELSPRWESWTHHLLEAAIIVSIGWVMMGVTLAASDWMAQRYSGDLSETLEYRSINTQLRVFTHVIVFVIWLFTALAIIMTIPHLRSIGVSLFASAGVAGIVIGMAAGPTLSNLIAGIQLALTQPIRIGDQISVGNVAGIVGTVSGIVEEIDSTYVVVVLWDKRRLIVPLNYFIQNQFQNWTHTANSSIIGRASIFVDYTVPVEPVRQELETVMKTLPLWDGKLFALEVVDITNGKVAELRASFSTRDARSVFTLQCQVREALLGFVQRKNAA